jgi:hypothetical protein
MRTISTQEKAGQATNGASKRKESNGMKGRLGVYWIASFIFIATLFLSAAAHAQDPEEPKGINSGGYNIQQIIEFGYRSSNINGNMNTYNTFENLGSGIRLFDFELKMHALDHNGFLFDNLTFSNFGYGGDPNNVSRLRVEKNKIYDFRVLFRRDKNFWDYNLFANPLNPAALNPAGSLTTGCIVGPPTAAFPQGAPGYCSNPAVAQNTSIDSMYLTRRMQDYDLTMFPTSKVRFRLGYSRNRNQGPGGFSTDGGTISAFDEVYSYTTNAYRAGVDVRILPKTTISFDEFLSYFKQDNTVIDNPAVNPGNFQYILANPTANGTPAGTPVDLGNIWSTQTTAEVLPCGPPVIVAGTTNTATPTCNGFLSYSQVGNPRNFMPTERLRFQSNYFSNFEMSGSAGYSTSNNQIPDFLETVNGYTVRTGERGSTTGGPADAKRVSVNADWTGVYAVTNNLRVLDSFRYDNWRIPGMWALAETNIYGTSYAGLEGSQQSQAVFNTTNCPVDSNAVTCPFHTATSAADVINGLATSFLGQNLKSNTLELEYDFTKRFEARIGYLYTDRIIAQYSNTNDTEEIYYPGGTAAAPGNDYLAARGSCAPVAGALPAGCILNADGSVTFTPATAAAPVRSLTPIHENALLLGAIVRPIDSLRITGDLEFGYNDASYTRIDPRQVQSYKVHANYKPRPWATVDGAVEIHENRDNVATVDNLEHDRSYSFGTILTASPRLSVDFGYNYWDVYTQALICFAYSITSANPVPPPTNVTDSTFPPGVPTGPACPATAGGASVLGATSSYASTDHFAHAAVIWKPMKRVTTVVGYGGSFVRGSTIFLNPLTPSGTLDFNYQRPYVSITIDVYRGLSYKMSWNYFGFTQVGNTSPFGLAAIQSPSFNGSNATFSFRYSF